MNGLVNIIGNTLVSGSSGGGSTPAPSNFTVEVTDNDFALTWDTVTGATNYILERSVYSNFTDATEVYSGTNTFFDDEDLEYSQLYYWRVKAQSELGDSSYSTTSGITSVPVATDDTETYDVLSTFDNTRYYMSSLLHQSPFDKDIILHTYTDGVHHVDDETKKMVYRLSTDRGLTFGAQATLYDPTDGDFQIQDPGAGLDSNGRLHIFADCHTDVGTPGDSELRYMYSDDFGTTVSSPVVITLPSNGLNAFRVYGRMIQAGSVLMAPVYFQADEGDVTSSARYVLRSTNFGISWTWVLIEGPTTEYINETALLSISDTVIIAVSRWEGNKQFCMYKSLDAGLTWTNCGILRVGNTTQAGPCRLLKFQADDGTWLAAMYFPNRQNDRLYGLYGRLDDFITAGVGGWNMNTLTLLRQDTEYLHYGDMCHYNNNFNARGAWTREASTTPLVDNELVYFENPSTHYDSVITALTPETIYDRLGMRELVASFRGLVTNTNNAYGIVNGSSQITTLKSILPGPTGRDFTATAGGIVLTSGAGVHDGTKALTHNSAAVWDFMSYNANGEKYIKYTIHAAVRFGSTADPNAFYGMLGNNGASSATKGSSIFFDDRASVPRNNALVLLTSKGTLGFIVNFINQDVVTPNGLSIVTFEVDLQQSSNNDKVKLYINGTLISTTVTDYNTGVVTTPTYNLQIGAIGNNGAILVGAFKDLVIQNMVDLPSVRSAFIEDLMDANGF